MNQTLFPPEARDWRKLRIGAMALSFVLPGLLHFSNATLMSFVYPSPRRAVLLALIGFQIYRLVRPEHAQPRTVELWNSTWGAEVSTVFLSLLAGSMYYRFIPVQLLGMSVANVLFPVLDCLMALTLLSPATKTVIDGEARTITVTGLFPKVFHFSDIPGLGVIEVELRRNGYTVGRNFFLGLFARQSAPTRLLITTEPQINGQINAIVQHTGAPAARKSA